jgi:phosphatidylglycerol---prolipoprotein diacylglyceryl transferase
MADPTPLVAATPYWVDDLSPFIIRFGNSDWGVRWYGMAYLAGLAWGYWMLVRWLRLQRSPVALQEIQDFVLYGGLGMIIGGRLGYCLLYEPHELFTHPFYLFMLWKGGMASHGGIIGLIVGTLLFARRSGKSALVLMDLIAVTGPMGVALGRIANFINGELWGRPTTVPWAVIFPNSVDAGGLPPAEARAWQISHALPRHPSQLYAAFLEGFLILAILMPLHARHRRPGLTGGMFFMLYAIARFIDEFFREPDFGQPGSPGHPGILGFMSKGQAYTIPFFIAGAIAVFIVLRRPPRPDLYVAPAQPKPPADSGTAAPPLAAPGSADQPSASGPT